MLRLSVTGNSKTCASSGGRPNQDHFLLPPGLVRGDSKQEFESRIENFYHESQDMWDQDLPWFALAFNTAVHESTRYTPDVLFLGRELRCPLADHWYVPGGDVGNPGDLNQFWTQACGKLLAARNRVDQRFNKGRKPHRYKEGDLVRYRLRLASSKGQNNSAKLSIRWSPPSTIAKFVRPNVVLLAKPDTGVIIRGAHVSQFKTCH
jgi:hypothetical protein